MASNPPGECCTKGTLHKGTPRGESVKIDGGIEGYLSRPQGKTKGDTAILYMPDIFGIWPNSQLMADTFADRGYTTLVIDMFNGDQLPPKLPEGLNLMDWFSNGSDGKNPHTPNEIDPVIVKGLQHLRSLGAKRIGAVGYCIGAKYVIRHFKDGIDVGFVAHPSFVQKEELEAITGPLSIAAAEFDDIFPQDKRHESEETLAKVGQPYQINLFSGVHHGFAVRGDPEVKLQRYAKEQAFDQAVAWFDNHLVQ
ncbi:hypothetical protein S40285_07927 [Stachybotrys chlorohalonatus IBT 40285]|uniref:Dienelactone hydrolase domain-containing protein n=1 Tax=Stachybotrys chlorohalonatus (strain IBT 40285) TaxID=1283841 RepID=A0A084R105_STAC4|nr:hypothetical protein S40285_07927 [Stachybotrys chlorohalonata IBT 40285]